MKKRDRIRGMDGLRAIAILGVVYYHMIPNILPGGFLGVNAFFTIMGFLMIYNVRSAFEEDSPLKFALHYYEKKILRLYPSLLVMISSVILLMFVFAGDFAKPLLSEVISILGGYNNWWQVLQNSSYFDRMMNSSPFTHLWYMGLTVQYYLLWPLLFIGGAMLLSIFEKKKPGKGKLLLCGVMGGLALLFMLEMALLYNPDKDPSRIYYGTDTRAFALLLGMITGLLPIREFGRKIHSKNKKLIRKAWIPALLLFVVIMAMYLKVSGESAINYRLMMQLNSILFTLFLILVIIDQRRLGWYVDTAPLKFLGKYSYEVYLVMYPVIWFIQRKFPEMRTGLYVIVCTVLIAAFAAFVHAIPALYSDKVKPRFQMLWLNKAVPALALVLCLIITLAQTAYSKSLGGEENMQELEAQLAESEAALSDNNAAQLAMALRAQLASVDANVVYQSEIVKTESLRRAALAGSAEAAPAEGEAPAQPEAPTAPVVQAVVSGTAVGDSVMLGASGALQSAMNGLYVDAAVSRQINAGPGIIATLASQGLLGNTVVIHLGTNGVRKLSEYQDIVNMIGPGHQIFWVNTKGEGWYQEVNANIDQIVAANENVQLIDWYNYSVGHPEWFAADNIHLNGDGAAAYAELIKSATGL